MKILQQCVGLVSNSEVLQILKQRGADGGAANATALASEKILYQYLVSHSCGHKTGTELAAFIKELQPYKLTRAEVLQVMNLVPSTEVELYLIVEECEERLGADQVQELLQLVDKYLVGSSS